MRVGRRHGWVMHWLRVAVSAATPWRDWLDDIPTERTSTASGTLPHQYKTMMRWQSASQLLPATPFLSPSSHSSPNRPSTLPSPQEGTVRQPGPHALAEAP